MLRRFCSVTLASVALLTLSAIIAHAQSGELRGHVTLKQADGTSVPGAGAIIDVFRIDIKSDYHTKTDKRGDFVFAGLPYTGDYIIGVSLANAQGTYQDGVKVGRDIVFDIVMNPGDGRHLTLDEIRAAMKSGPPKAGARESAADKAKREDAAKQAASYAADKKKTEDANSILNSTFKAGNDALKAKNYEEAIKQYDTGIAADPTHPGVPSLLTNKSAALRMRGVDQYNASIKLTDDAAKTAARDAAKKDWNDAAEAAAKAVDLLKAQTTPTDAAQASAATSNKYYAFFARKEALRLVVSKSDPTQADATIASYQEYMGAETDAAKKSAAEHELAQALFDANVYDKARTEYEKILAATPDDPDALANMGLILYNLGFTRESEGNKDEAKKDYQEAANYLQKFVDKAPDGHKFKADAQAVLENLKSQQNVQAEKTTPTPRTRRRP